MKLLFILLIFTYTTLFSSEKSLTIAVYNDMAPYVFKDRNGNLNGLFIDYWKLWGKKSNINVEFIDSTWKDTIENVKSGKVDIHSGLFKNKQRDKFLTYTKRVYLSTSNLYTSFSRRNDFNSISDFNDKKVGVIKSTYYEDILNTSYPEINVVVFKSFLEVLNALHSNDIDAFLYDDLITWYSLIENLGFNDVKKNDSYTLKKWFYPAVKKDNLKLKKTIEDGIRKITREEILYLENKWIPDEKLKTLRNLYSVFNDEEVEFINNNRIKVGISQWSPIFYKGKNKQIGGLSGDFLKKFVEMTDSQIDIHFSTWDKLLDDMKNKKIDLLLAAAKDEERSKYALFSDPYFYLSNKIFIKEENSDIIKGFDDLKGKKLALIKGDFRIKKIKDINPEIIIEEVYSVEEQLNKLLSNEVDAIVDTDIIISNQIKKRLITNIVSVDQTKIEAEPISMMVQKDKKLLLSIINKFFASISTFEKNRILTKWLENNQKEINILQGKNKAPFSFINSSLPGIEQELINKIFENSDFKLNFLPKESKGELFNNEILVLCNRNENTQYFSTTFLPSNIVAISRSNDKFEINDIEDLKNKKIIAFKNAKKYIGGEFNNYFNEKTNEKNYNEYQTKESTIQEFVSGKGDVLIIDENIFDWFFKNQIESSKLEYKYHYIFPSSLEVDAVFKNKQLQEFFLKRLNALKQSGKYDEILSKYLKNNLKEKLQLTTFLSNVIAQDLYTNNLSNIKDIGTALSKLSFINRVEITTLDRNQYSFGENKNSDFIEEESFYLKSLSPKKAGKIKIYFNNEIFKDEVKKSTFIPRLDIFEKLNSYTYIRKIYKDFKLSINDKSYFTKEEIEFIENHPIIRVSEVNWQPLSIVEKGKFKGIFRDYLNIVEEKTGLEFKFVPSSSWLEAINLFKKKDLGILPVVDTPTITNVNPYMKMGLLTDDFVDFNYAIVSNDKGLYIDDLKELEGKTVALPKGYTSYNFIKKVYPKINIVEVKTVKEALLLVSRDKVDAFVGHVAVSIFNITNFFPDLKIVGLTNNKFNHHFIVQKEFPLLKSIINKVISNIDISQKQEIKDKWIKVKLTSGVDYNSIYKAVCIILIIFLAIFIWNRKLKSIVSQKTHELNKLLDSYDKSVIASKVDIDGNIVYASYAFCKKFEYSQEELIGRTHEFLRHPSTDKEIVMQMKKTYANKEDWKGELMYQTKSGKTFWAYVKRKAEYDKNGKFIDFINTFYDITNHKEVEKLNHELSNLLSSFDENVIASKAGMDGKIIYVSNAFCSISEYSKSELLNKSHSILKHKNTSNELYEDLWSTIKNGRVWRGEIKDVSKSGRAYWLYTIITPEYDIKGNFLCFTAISQDITHQKLIAEANRQIEILNTEIEDTQKEVVFRMGSIAEARSKETGMHVKRVAEYTKLLALYYGLDKKEAEILKQASPMHDIGKVAIPDHILNKPGRFTNEEFEIMKTHTTIGFEMLNTSDKVILKTAAIIAHEHQEKYDGSGYPRGLKGSDIHIYGRITAIADVFDALGSDRCYKKAWDDERIFEMFKKEKGKHFDPILIDIFFEHLSEFLAIRDKFKDED